MMDGGFLKYTILFVIDLVFVFVIVGVGLWYGFTTIIWLCFAFVTVLAVLNGIAGVGGPIAEYRSQKELIQSVLNKQTKE
jgi:hypothetical protein